MNLNRNIWIGLGMMAASYLELLIPKQWMIENHFQAGFPLSFAVALFVFGTIFLCEGIVQKVGGTSLLSLARGGGFWKWVRFLVVAAVVGVTLEIFAQWLGHLWYYAYYPEWFYWPALVPSFILYWVLIVETYMAAKALLDRVIKRGGKSVFPAKQWPVESSLYVGIGTIGMGMFVFGTVRGLLEYFIEQRSYEFNPYTATAFGPSLRYIITACVGLWMVSEAILYVRQRTSLVNSFLHGYYVPILAIIAASLFLSLVWEPQNAMVDYWVYTHWPWPDKLIFGVQLSVILTWPLHYLVYLALPAAIVAPWANAFFARPEGWVEPGERRQEKHAADAKAADAHKAQKEPE
jgi:hypothetical protein